MNDDAVIPREEKVSQISKHILDMADASRQHVLSHAHKELILLHHNVGKCLVDISAAHRWGVRYLNNIASSIVAENPSIKGFDRCNLYRMRQFYFT